MCEWHSEIQSCIDEINDLICSHKVKILTEEESRKSLEWNVKFQEGPKKGKSMWEKIKNFYCKPSIFKMKELQIYLEADIKKQYHNESIGEIVNATIAKIENQVRNELEKNGIEEKIREGLKKKFPLEAEEKIEKKLHAKIEERIRNMNVKGHLSGDLEKYQSDKAEYLVEDAISKIMFNKPGLLRRGLKCEKRTYQHLKDILGDITPNCPDKSCIDHKERLQKRWLVFI